MNVAAVALKRPLVYVAVSYTVFALFVLDYVSTYQDLYTIMIHMTNSSVFMVLLVNAFLATVFVVWTVVRVIFFGSLNGSEREALQGAAAIYFMECVLSPLYLGESIMSPFTVYLIGLVMLRTFHKLAEERVTTLAITDDVRVRRWKSVRLAAFLACALLIDLGVTRRVWSETMRLRAVVGAKMDPDGSSHTAALVMAWSAFILVCQCTLSAVRCIIRLQRTLTNYGEDGHTPIAFYATNISNLAESIAVVCMIITVWSIAGPPFFLFRLGVAHILRCDEAIRNLTRYVLLSRRVHHFDDVQPADLERETRCTICYDEMVAGPSCKRLPCGHCYHDHCLRGWFESNASCPYCRAKVLRPRGQVPGAPQDVGVDMPGVNAAGAEGEIPRAPGHAHHDEAAPPLAEAQPEAPQPARVEPPDAEVRAAYAAYLASLKTAGPRFAEAANRRATEGAAAPPPPPPPPQPPVAMPPLPPTPSPPEPPAVPTIAAAPRTHPLLSKVAEQRHRMAETTTPALTQETIRETVPASAARAANTEERRQAARLEAYRVYEEQIAEAQRTLKQALATLDGSEGH